MNMRAVMLPSVLVLAGCVGAGGSSGGGLSQDLAATRAEYVIVDLATGVATTTRTAPDLAADQGRMVFRRIPHGTATLGAPNGEVGRQDDEVRQTAESAAYYIAVTECTQGQWQRLAATTPWSGSGLPVGDSQPAYGLSYAVAETAVVAGNLRMRGGRLALPSAVEWERACRGGSDTAYSWGSATGQAAVAAQAVVAETRTGDGPLVVAGRAANGYGLYDMHGNVWEFSADGDLHGGSWLDPLTLARAANRQEVEPDTALPIAGVRLCWRPSAP